MNNVNRASFHEAYIQGDKQIQEILRTEIKSPSHSLIKFCNGSYCSDSSNFYLKSLKEDKLWVSSPTEFNDPCEFMLSYDNEKLYKDACKKEFNKHDLFLPKDIENIPDFKHNVKQMNDIDVMKTKELRERCFVSCFSERDALVSQAMWGYYANCHKGFCLEYSYGEMIKRFPQGIIPIRYSNVRDVNPFPNSDVDCCTYRLALGFTKAKEWEHENEWRLVVDNEIPMEEKGRSIDFFKPMTVYMGVKISPELKKDLIDICSQREIGLFQMIIETGTYLLNAERVL